MTKRINKLKIRGKISFKNVSNNNNKTNRKCEFSVLEEPKFDRNLTKGYAYMYNIFVFLTKTY